MHPADEWTRLTAVYAAMFDEQLLELAAAREDLTDVAKEVLRDELNRRALHPSLPKQGIPLPGFRVSNQTAVRSQAPMLAPDGTELHYTWKVELGVFHDAGEAFLLKRALEEAGFDCYDENLVEPDGKTYFKRLQVAADQLDGVQAFVAQLTPAKLQEFAGEEPGEFLAPACPRCSADPLLLSADPVNEWLCESCGKRWSEDIGAASQ